MASIPTNPVNPGQVQAYIAARRAQTAISQPLHQVAISPRTLPLPVAPRPLPPISDSVDRPHLVVQGMHGLGDNLHQRALMRQLLRRYNVTLQSSWFSLYWDLIESGLRVVMKTTHLRTQNENAARERHLFHKPTIIRNPEVIRMWYRPQDIRTTGSVLGAMCSTIGPACDQATADFRIPVHPSWLKAIDERIQSWNSSKPILFYRPLSERPGDWSGCKARNPDFKSYYSLIQSIRDQFFVVSVAHLTTNGPSRNPLAEYMVGQPIIPDVMLHKGELVSEHLVALMKRSSLCFCSPGNAIVMAQAVSTPVVCVFGGYENSSSFSVGARWTPTLGIDPIHPCSSFTHTDWDKRIDMPKALSRLQQFVDQYAHAATNRVSEYA